MTKVVIDRRRIIGGKCMCNRCDYDSSDNQIYVDPLTNEYYLDIETSEWDEYDDGFVHQREYISYCPWCGRKLGE